MYILTSYFVWWIYALRNEKVVGGVGWWEFFALKQLFYLSLSINKIVTYDKTMIPCTEARI